MRVVISINTSWNIYNFRKGLIKSLLEEGMEVIAVAPRDEYSKKIEALGCKFVPIQMENKGTNPTKDYVLYKRFLRIYGFLKPDVVLQYTIKPNIYGSLAAKSLGIPVINNVSGLGTVFLHKGPVYKLAQQLYRYAFRYPAKVFFQNRDDQDLFVDKKLVKPSISAVLPGSGVDLLQHSKVAYSKEEPFKFLMLSRVLHDKGVREYAEASMLLKRKGYKFICQLAGALDSSKMGVPEREVDNWHKKGYIEYLGELSDVDMVLSQCQCAVLPSYREGTPKSLLEAGAKGKPIITTDAPGCKEVLIDGESGYLCDVKSAEDLMLKMEMMINLSEQELISFSNNSRKFIEQNFDEKLVIDKYIKEIKKVECK